MYLSAFLRLCGKKEKCYILYAIKKKKREGVCTYGRFNVLPSRSITIGKLTGINNISSSFVFDLYFDRITVGNILRF